MITRRKLFGLLAGLPFVKALPAAAPNPANVVIGEMWAGVDIARDTDHTSYVMLHWEPVPDAIGYRIYGREKTRIEPIFYDK